jgi:hypothetical protein
MWLKAKRTQNISPPDECVTNITLEMQICYSDSVTVLCWRFRELQTRGCNMPDIAHTFQHACMLHNHKLPVRRRQTRRNILTCLSSRWEAEEARRALKVSGHKGEREGQEKPFMFLDANTNTAALRTRDATGDTRTIR